MYWTNNDFREKDTDISSTLLKMHNNLNKSKKSLLYLPHISKNNGVTGEKVEIMIKKWKIIHKKTLYYKRFVV